MATIQEYMDYYAKQYGLDAPSQAPAVAPIDFSKLSVPAPVTTQEPEGDLKRGFKNYLPQLQQTWGAAKTIVGQTLGSEGLVQSGLQSMDEGERALVGRTKPTDEFTNIQGPGDFADWLQYQTGQTAANIAEAGALAIGGGVAGGVAGGPVGTGAGAVAGIFGKQAVKSYLKTEAGKIAARRAGSAVALGGMAAVRGLGEVGGRAIDEAGGDLSQVDLGAVYAAGAAHAGLEYVGDRILLNALGGKGLYRAPGTGVVPALKTIGGNMAKVAAKEMPIEVGQTMLERTAANLPLNTPDAYKEYINVAAATAVFGVAGIPGGVRSYYGKPSNEVTDQELINTTDDALFGQVPPPPVAAPTPAPMAPPVVDVRGQPQIPGVPAAPVSPQDVTTGQDRPFAGTPDTELRRTLRALEERAVSGQASSRDMNLMRIVQAELEQREGMAPAGMVTRTGTLFDENARFERRGPEARRPEAEDVNARLAAAAQQAPAQQEQPLAGITPAPAEQGLELPVTEQARQQRVQQMRALAKQLGGGRDTQFTKKLNAQNETELTAAVIAELERGTSSNQIMQLAEGLGIIDANGQPRDFDREVQVAQQQLANAQRAATSPFENAEQLTAAREQIAVAERNLAEVQRRRDVVNAALTPQQAPEQEAANAVQEPRPTEVDVRQPTQDGGKMAERNTKKQASARKGKKQEVAPKDAPAVERAIDGVSTPALVLAVEQNNLQAALQEMIDDKTNAYTDLEKLVARRLLMAKSLPNIEIVKAENMVPEKDGSIPAARYFVEDDTIRIVEGEADSHIVLHEAIHAFLHSRIKAFERGDFFSQNLSNLQKLFQYLQKNNPELASQYAFTNLSEFASEAMSNREFQEQLRDIPYQRQSVFTWFAQQVMKLLGINQNQASNALAAAMISVEGDMISGREMQTAITGAASTEAPASMQRITAPQTREVLGNFQTVTNVADAVKEKLQNVPYADMGVNLFRGILGWQTKFNLVAGYDKVLNGALQLNIDADNIQEATAARFNQMFNEPYHKLEALERSNPKAFETVHELMAATAYQIDPRKTWEEHGHLQKLEGRKLAQAKKDVAEYRQKWGRLPEDVQQIYTDLSTMNEAIYTAERAVQMYNLARANEGAKMLPEFTKDPTAEFRSTAEAHGSPQAAQRYWRGVLEAYLVAADRFVEQQRKELPQKDPDDPEYVKAVKTALKNVTDPKIRTKIRAQLRVAQDAPMTDLQKAALRHLRPIEAHAKAVRETIATFNQAPYFHLGRFGEQYVSFRVKMLEDGTADPAAMEVVQERLRDRFDMVSMRKDGLDPHVFARFESVDQSQAFVNELRKLQAEGYLMQEGEKDKNNRDLGAIVSGTRKQVLTNYTSASTEWLDQFIETVKAEGYPDDVAQRIIAHARSMYLDSLPDTAAIKIQQRREGRPGWNSDMIRSYAHRMRIGANKISSLAAQPVRTDSFATMNDAYAQMETNPEISEAAKAKARAVIDEFERRDKDRADMPSTPGIDQLRAINSSYFLGLSPSYVMLQISQLGALTWPELVKTNGAVRSAKVLAQVSPLAFNVLRQVVKEGYQTRGIKGATDFVITADTLKRSGLSPEDAQFLTEIMASGKLDIGNFAREMMRVIEGDAQGDINEKLATALKIASSFGYMSETATRMISALAAGRLYDPKKHAGMTKEQYAIRIIDESMLNYNHQNIGRLTGKKGFAGTLTPVMLSFMQYQFQLLEKLYREMYNAISSDPKISAAQRTEARRFLGAHLSAMMLLAGSLGLPFATVVAKAADELCELFSDGPCDSKAALRNYTADVFGSDIEAMINRGIVPRALGFDITQRAGEADILPFSRFLADKRAMEDRIKDLTADSWGAPTSMIANILIGFEKIAQGDVTGGLQTALPIALRGPVNAYALTQKGYVDQSGNKLPMDAGAYDMMIQSVGLTPGELADYRQARMVQAQRVGVLTREATLIRQKLATAYENQDREAAAKWFKEAQKFDARNPQSPILPTLGSTLMQRAKARTLAENFGTPLGVRPQDVEGRELTRFFQP